MFIIVRKFMITQKIAKGERNHLLNNELIGSNDTLSACSRKKMTFDINVAALQTINLSCTIQMSNAIASIVIIIHINGSIDEKLMILHLFVIVRILGIYFVASIEIDLVRIIV